MFTRYFFKFFQSRAFNQINFTTWPSNASSTKPWFFGESTLTVDFYRCLRATFLSFFNQRPSIKSSISQHGPQTPVRQNLGFLVKASFFIFHFFSIKGHQSNQISQHGPQTPSSTKPWFFGESNFIFNFIKARGNAPGLFCF